MNSGRRIWQLPDQEGRSGSVSTGGGCGLVKRWCRELSNVGMGIEVTGNLDRDTGSWPRGTGPAEWAGGKLGPFAQAIGG